MKFLVTGGSGFLGSNLSDYILSINEELIIYDNLSRYGSELNLEYLKNKGSFKFFKDDIRNIFSVEEVIRNEKPDIIFHFAGQVSMISSILDPLFDFEVNAKGTLNLLESVRKYSPNSIVCFSSTNKIYGDLEYLKYAENEKRYTPEGYETGFDENLRLDFQSPYGCSKGCADQYMLDFNKIFGIKTIIFRHSSIFGERQFSTVDQGWIGWFCQKAYEIKNNLTSNLIDIHGTGKQVRDILFSKDLTNCYIEAIKNISKTEGNCYNIGGGIENSYSLLELFDELSEMLKIEIKTNNLEFRKSDQKFFVANTNKAKNDFGLKVKISKKDGLRKMYDWVEKVNYDKK